MCCNEVCFEDQHSLNCDIAQFFPKFIYYIELLLKHQIAHFTLLTYILDTKQAMHFNVQRLISQIIFLFKLLAKHFVSVTIPQAPGGSS